MSESGDSGLQDKGPDKTRFEKVTKRGKTAFSRVSQTPAQSGRARTVTPRTWPKLAEKRRKRAENSPFETLSGSSEQFCPFPRGLLEGWDSPGKSRKRRKEAPKTPRKHHFSLFLKTRKCLPLYWAFSTFLTLLIKACSWPPEFPEINGKLITFPSKRPGWAALSSLLSLFFAKVIPAPAWPGPQNPLFRLFREKSDFFCRRSQIARLEKAVIPQQHRYGHRGRTGPWAQAKSCFVRDFRVTPSDLMLPLVYLAQKPGSVSEQNPTLFTRGP